MSEAVVALAAGLGVLLGVLAERLAVRWPEHEDDYLPRPPGWRTAIVALGGGAALGGLAWRWDDPLELLLLGIFAAALIVLLATDLDQRMLPDLLTLPLIGYAALLLVLGRSPLLGGLELGWLSGLVAGLAAPALLLLSDRLLRGDLGGGDVKLAASIGLLAGVSRLLGGFLVASVAFAAILLLLMLLRRIGPRSHVPFGPVLIGAGLLAMVIG